MTKSSKIIIVAMTEQLLIGSAGHIPWQIPEELRLFRELTSGHTLIMGRHTFTSIGRPLPDRRTIVVSRHLPATQGIEICPDIASALRLAESYGEQIFFAGGVGIYQAALPLADLMHISWIKGAYAGDTYFPTFDIAQWQAISERDYGPFRHVLYRRR
jgi:dihydrofolate reductase